MVRLNALYWPTVVVVLWATAGWLAAEPGARSLFPLDREQFRVFAIVGAAGAVVAAAVRILMRGGRTALRHTVLWTAVLMLAVLGYDRRSDFAEIYKRFRGTIYPSVALSRAQGAAELRRGWDGHYRARAMINGTPVRMLVDTGATMVLLPYESVRALGIDPESLDYSLPVITANGKSTVAPVTLASIRIGPISVVNVEAAVARPGRLKTALLGMSFLEQLTETTFRRGRLILRN